jgi:hypothetical protein
MQLIEALSAPARGLLRLTQVVILSERNRYCPLRMAVAIAAPPSGSTGRLSSNGLATLISEVQSLKTVSLSGSGWLQALIVTFVGIC